MEYWLNELIRIIIEVLSAPIDEDEIIYPYEDEIKFED